MKLQGKKVAILATDGYEQSELFSPREALQNAGATVHIISDHDGQIKAWDKDNWGKKVDVDKTLESTVASDYDGLMLPGGVINPDTLRTNRDAMGFIRDFFKEGKPVAAICHAPQLLISANVIEGRKVTSYKSIQQDIENAGAQWVNEAVVVDSGLVTSRTPDDLDAFNKKLVEEIAEGVHKEQKQSV
mgnify:CR=1 FL=1